MKPFVRLRNDLLRNLLVGLPELIAVIVKFSTRSPGLVQPDTYFNDMHAECGQASGSS